MLEPELYPAQDLIAIYAWRWNLELCFRDLKTTLGMEQLRCKSPDMVEKELLAFLVAHNLIRCVMAQAATVHQVPLDRISFKGMGEADAPDRLKEPARPPCSRVRSYGDVNRSASRSGRR